MMAAVMAKKPIGGAAPYAENHAWELDRAALAARSERRAWNVAIGACGIAVVAIIAVALQGPLHQFQAVPIVVDKATGETSVARALASDSVPAVEALDKHNVANLVLARERYNWAFLQADYDAVRALSAPDVFKGYASQFEGGTPLQKKLSDHTEWRVKIINVRLTPDTAPGQHGDAIVTYERQVIDRSKGDIPDPPTRNIATVRYTYKPTTLTLNEVSRLANPLGFVATSYRSDPEINTNVPKEPTS
jgi:type IV secretion system protein VirB8